MRWSVKLGRFAGIDVFVHFTFLLLLAVIAYQYWLLTHEWIQVAEGVGFFLSIFACVLLHEFGHALMAKRFGVPTKDITLLPIGGIARLERLPEKPIQELWVAMAGPAVNGLIAAALAAYLVGTGGVQGLSALGLTEGGFLTRLMFVNLWLIGFNMLPAFPMDGGRVLRALLAMRMDYARATQVAATMGQGMAILFALAGLTLPHVMLLFIAIFVWIGASQEAASAQFRSTFSGVRVAQAMMTDFRSLSPSEPLSHAVQLILAGSQSDFPILESQRLVGILTRADLVAALAEHGAGFQVGQVMKSQFTTVGPDELLENALAQGKAGDSGMLPVLDQGRLVGLLTLENIGEFALIRSALRDRRA